MGYEQMNTITYNPIGIIHTPHNNRDGIPIQPAAALGIPGTIEIFPEYLAGLKDIEGFSHIILIYHFHLSEGFELIVKPFLDENVHGVFATSPKKT